MIRRNGMMAQLNLLCDCYGISVISLLVIRSTKVQTKSVYYKHFWTFISFQIISTTVRCTKFHLLALKHSWDIRYSFFNSCYIMFAYTCMTTLYNHFMIIVRLSRIRIDKSNFRWLPIHAVSNAIYLVYLYQMRMEYLRLGRILQTCSSLVCISSKKLLKFTVT